MEAHLLPLRDVLGDARTLGLVGPGSLEGQIGHALGFAQAVGERPDGLVVDLGSGGGLPGLALALAWPESRWLLVDGRSRSTSFLRDAVGRLGLGDRVVVEEGRAEELAHDPEFRGGSALVLARGFGPPAVTAECGAGFLAVRGRLVVSEPPESSGDRWRADGLSELGLVLRGMASSIQAGYAVLEQVSLCPARYPRRTGIPAKRPLF